MIIAIYKDDGTLHGGGQDMERTSPWEKAVPFLDYDAFRRANNALSEETAQRKNPRYIKWYEVESAIPRAEVAAALDALRDQYALRAMYSNENQVWLWELDATIAALNLPAAKELSK